MAKADYIKSLVRAHFDRNDERFRTITLQIAASEAKQGHAKLARELKDLALNENSAKSNVIKLNTQNSMFIVSNPSYRFSDLIVSSEIESRIMRIIKEFNMRNELHKHGLANRRKILIEGAPGTGKTLTASVIASELELPLYTIQMDKLVTKYMGETSVKLRQIFDSIENSIGVYFFDEFDAIGADRNFDNEVGEMRRILNSFLQFIEQDSSNSIIVAATNNQQILDRALFRRFDDILHYTIPTEEEIKRIYESKLSGYQADFRPSQMLIKKSKSLSHSEITRVCDDAIKDALLSSNDIFEGDLTKLIFERKQIYSMENR